MNDSAECPSQKKKKGMGKTTVGNLEGMDKTQRSKGK